MIKYESNLFFWRCKMNAFLRTDSRFPISVREAWVYSFFVYKRVSELLLEKLVNPQAPETVRVFSSAEHLEEIDSNLAERLEREQNSKGPDGELSVDTAQVFLEMQGLVAREFPSVAEKFRRTLN